CEIEWSLAGTSNRCASLEVIVEEFLIVIIQVAIEGLAETFIYLPFDSSVYSNATTGERNGCGLIFVYLVIGGALGGLSVLIAPHLLLPSAMLRVANFLTAPVVAGGVGWWAAKGRTNRKDHFWFGFCFALAFSGVRLAYGAR